MSGHDNLDRIDIATPSGLEATAERKGRYWFVRPIVAVSIATLATLSSSIFPWGARHPAVQLVLIKIFAAGFAILCIAQASTEKPSTPKS